MFLQFDHVLSSDDLETLQKALKEAPFVDETDFANPVARKLKTGLRLIDQNAAVSLGKFLNERIHQIEDLGLSVCALKNSLPMFSRYEPGMSSSARTDDTYLSMGEMTLRSDLAGTLFLSDPQEYEGGELVLHQGFTRLKLKPEANTLVVYPANLIHEVSVVTQGVSERASLYFQSLIASHEHRAVLWDLQCARKKLLNHDGDSELLTTLHRTVQELLRLWAHV